MIVLYDYWRSSAAYRVRLALDLLGLPYTSVPVDLTKGEHRTPANLARNPQGLVPTLEIDGLRLTQSVAMLEYLQETRGGLLPDDPGGRARVRALVYAVAMEIAPIANLSLRTRIAEITEGRTSAEAWQVWVIERGFRGLEGLLASPATGRFCHGDTLTMADLCLLPQLYNARRAGVDLTPFPQISAVAAALDADPRLAGAHPDRHRPP
jgi:maleylacetoacetate isomerase